MKKQLLWVCAALCAWGPGFSVRAVEVKGAGSTAAAPLYNAWAQQWSEASGHKLSYAGVGSSGGIKSIKEGKSDFGASDVALSREELDKEGLVNFPVAISGIVPFVNLQGVSRGQLRLTGSVLADILAGRITRWNAPEIAALNRNIKLPAQEITVVAREDGSGTTYVLSHYLAKVSQRWAQDMGYDFKLKWSERTTLVKGTGGMLEAVRKTSGAIGYAEYGQVQSASLNYVRVANQRGQYPEPGAASFKAALADSPWTSRGAYEEMLTNATGFSAWPITGATFVIMRRHVQDAERASTVLSMLSYGFMRGDKAAADLNWIPLPDSTQARVEREMLLLVDKNGHSLTWQISH